MTAALATAPQPSRGVDRTAGTVLFLVADTGGGHRAAAAALIEALDRDHPGRFVAVDATRSAAHRRRPHCGGSRGFTGH